MHEYIEGKTIKKAATLQGCGFYIVWYNEDYNALISVTSF